jgi:hypothetical protein
MERPLRLGKATTRSRTPLLLSLHRSMPSARRFPPPRTLDERNDACFIVRDNTGQALGYFYFEDEPGRRSAAKLLTKQNRVSKKVDPVLRQIQGLS